MPKNIIADTSCLVLLENINELDILHKLFGTIFVTPTIADEFGADLPDWIKVKKIQNKKYQTLLEATVDPGEASAIALADEIEGLVILDDLKARRLASKLSLDYTGTLGILVDAKQCGYIDSFRDLIRRIKETNFYLNETLESKLLDMTDE